MHFKHVCKQFAAYVELHFENAHVVHHLLHKNLCINMLTMSNEKDWFSAMTGRKITVVEIAKHLDVNRNTATTRLQDGLSSDEIIDLSRKLHINPVTALEELGKVTIQEVFDYLDSDGTLAATASPELLIFYLAESSLSIKQKRELLERVQPSAERDDLATRREAKKSNSPTPPVQTSHYDPTEHAADSSPDEDALRAQQEGNDFE